MSASSSSGSIVTETVVAFLKVTPPFQFLPEYELGVVARTMALEYYPKDTVILRAGMKASDSLFIVQKGGVKLALRTGVGKELILDMRSEGEVFGLLSLMGRDVARLDVTAIEDTLCYTIPAEEVQRLISSHPEVSDYILRTSLTRYMDRSLKELREQTKLMGDSEQLLYSLSVGDAFHEAAVGCTESTTIQDAARIVAQANASCLFVLGGDGRARGIVTDKDFAVKVVARGMALDLNVTSIMSTPVIAVESGQRVFQALLEMINHDIHHVLVTQEGRPVGVLTNHDLLLLQGKSPLSVVRNLEQQQTLEGLAQAQKRVSDLLPLLLREGARASHITRVVAEINDRLMKRVLELAESKLGPAPAPYCWVTLGSEGRCEQTFKTDQDNALILTPGSDPEYFASLAEFARDALESCGYPRCTGNYMASNPFWRQSLVGWREYFSEWIAGATVRSVQEALIFFDLRPVAGDFKLFEALAAHNRELMTTAAFFKSVLGYISVEVKPPLGFFRTFVVERTGEHKQQLDLKMYGTGPIVNAARLLALDAGVEKTNTVDRLQALGAMDGQDAALLKDLQEAFEFLTMLRLESQLRQAREQRPLNNYIAPESLTHLQKSLLKEAFQAISRIQGVIESRFRSAIWFQLGR